ncbi:hypothetical protein PIB30_015164 [Stylosanthes scabra]|uniref:Receptor-like serine/threonine-protein kinase n=1 Tax=Stylosanthes scabra TaxID=79078 RepID=A0ABU6T6P1_9FABA|nr:hypothetical protein [Stylosanthes scabra]
MSYSFFLLLLLLYPPCCNSLDTITPHQPLNDGDVLLSKDRGAFALGFFSPANSKSRYLGIWFNNISQQTVVWVANRDTPLNTTSGVLSINNHGNLVLHDHNNSFLKPVWSSHVSVSTMSTNASAKLLDTGNFVLIQSSNNSDKVLWQSFDYPGNTYLPYMKLGFDRKTGLNRSLTSWKSPSDPGTGNATYKMDRTGFLPQLFLYANNAPLMRVGPWTGLRLAGAAEMTQDFIFSFFFIDDSNEVSSIYRVNDPNLLSISLLEETGYLRRLVWQGREGKWFELWNGPREECDHYRRCGSNSICNPYHEETFLCQCLPGFEPKSEREWYLKDGSSGCVRKANVSTCRSGEGFVELELVKAPDTSKASVNLGVSMEECRDMCLRDCSCAAYTSANQSSNSGCITWHGDMEDTRKFSQVGQTLFVRVDALELAKYAKHNGHGSPIGKKKMAAILAVSIFFFLFLVATIVMYWFLKVRKQFGRRRNNKHSSFRIHVEENLQNFDNSKHSDLPLLFDLASITSATERFSPANKLGQGGFGSVYKGCLINGREIAVKRLSKNSGQGTEEFKNEVTLLAKLQHRNLVRLLGCCFEKEERMLVYEYLPNKSLDFFIFDETQRSILNWDQRFEIIFGIARGILYLHQDSRLKIIHRDLKASNILLDATMNPKISDFGMAKIFGEDQIQARTRRVVGTYGYMSPEYAMEGQYSTKSDVFSFGVLLLEIVAGKRNTDHDHGRSSPNLIGYVWILWTEGKALDIVDSSLGQSYPCATVLRCIQVGLLCVQENVNNRPSMSEVIVMLGNEAPIRQPQKPAFLFNDSREPEQEPSAAIMEDGSLSVNGITTTSTIFGR